MIKVWKEKNRKVRKDRKLQKKKKKKSTKWALKIISVELVSIKNLFYTFWAHSARRFATDKTRNWHVA